MLFRFSSKLKKALRSDFNTLKIFLSDAEAASLWHIPLKNKCLLNATKWQLIYKIDVNELLRYFAVKIYRPIWRLRLIQIFLKCVPNAENNLYILFLSTCHLVTILFYRTSALWGRWPQRERRERRTELVVVYW